MIGSPDLVAFTSEEEYGQKCADPWVLPEEFSIPLHPLVDSNPWAKTNDAKFTKDFILISEFSEQVGPQPLITIPNDPKVPGTFDLNYFSLRIMSVDYQASFVGHTPGSGYPRLSFVEDSRVVLGDSKEGAFAYVHHLTLYDLEARGFVRPFCMAYVSADEGKIMLQFEELSMRFSQASECLKAGNRRAFGKELQRKLQDLEYTHSVLQREEGLQRAAEPQGIYSAHAVEKANELANVEKSIYEHRDLLRQISSYPHCPRRDPHAVTCQRCTAECLSECKAILDKCATLSNPSRYVRKEEDVEVGENQASESGEKDNSVKRSQSYVPQLIKAKSAKCFDKRLKTLQELCDLSFYESTMDLLRDTERNFRGELCYLHTLHLDRALRRKQMVSNFLFEEDFRDEHEHSGGILQPFCAVNHSAHSGTALCPPSIVVLPQHLEASYSQEASEVLGTSHTLTFSDGQLESSPSDQTLPTHDSSEDTKGSSSSVASQAENHPSPANLKPDTADCAMDLEGSSSEDMETTAGEDRGGDQTPVSVVDPVPEPEVNTGDSVVLKPELLVPMDASCCIAQEGFLQDTNVPEVLSNLCQNSHPQAIQTLVIHQEPRPVLLGLELTAGSLGDTVSHNAAAELDCPMSSSIGSDQASSPGGYGGVLTSRQRKKTGQAALRFVRQYPFAVQALWCLLSGRTLVVLGTDEGRVRRLVSALAVFVPGAGKSGERVQLLLSSPFALADLERWKLIGLQRVASPMGSSMLHSLSRYSRYISILDVDQRTLRCPPYNGQLLANIADHRTSICRGSTYFLHVQSLLCSLAAKAFLFTFTHHLHLPVSTSEGTEAVLSRRHCFLHEQLGLGEEDSLILRYLSQLITRQYLQPTTGGGQAGRSFSFNYTTSILYKM